MSFQKRKIFVDKFPWVEHLQKYMYSTHTENKVELYILPEEDRFIYFYSRVEQIYLSTE